MKSTVVSKLVALKVLGVVAGLLVITANIILINGMYSEWRYWFLGADTNVVFLVVFSIFPALLGIWASLHYNKPGKSISLRYGIFQTFLGLYLGALPILTYLPHNIYTQTYSAQYYYANVALAGSLIFIISGIYLVTTNSKLSRKVAR